jgi:hypothetical protein
MARLTCVHYGNRATVGFKCYTRYDRSQEKIHACMHRCVIASFQRGAMSPTSGVDTEVFLPFIL